MDIAFILWVVTFALFCIVVIQVFYLIFLSYIPNRRTQPRRSDSGNTSTSRQALANQAQPSGLLTGMGSQGPINTTTPVPNRMSRAVAATDPNLRSPTNTGVTVPPVFTGNTASSPSLISEIGKLIVLSGLSDQLEINLPGAEFGIGRFYNQERKILVVLDEKSISREHANFQYNAQLGQYFLTDKSSSYGTYILANDQFDPLTPEQGQQLFNGDVVQFGNQVKVRFILSGGTRASATQL